MNIKSTLHIKVHLLFISGVIGSRAILPTIYDFAEYANGLNLKSMVGIGPMKVRLFLFWSKSMLFFIYCLPAEMKMAGSR